MADIVITIGLEGKDVDSEAAKIAKTVEKEISKIDVDKRVTGRFRSAFHQIGDFGRQAANRLDREFQGLGRSFDAALSKLSALGNLPGLGRLGQVSSQVSGVSSALEQVAVTSTAAGAGMSALGLAAGGAGVAFTAAAAGMAASVKATAEYGRQISNATRITGISSAAVQALSRSAESMGQSMLDTIDAVNQFATQVADARGGSKELEGAFKSLGVNIKDTSLTTEQALDRALEALDRVPASIQKTSIASKLFGEEGSRLILSLKGTSGGLDTLVAKYRDLGAIIDDRALRETEKFNSALARLELRFEALKLQLGGALIPQLNILLGVFNSLERRLASPGALFQLLGALPLAPVLGASGAAAAGSLGESPLDRALRIGGAAFRQRQGGRSGSPPPRPDGARRGPQFAELPVDTRAQIESFRLLQELQGQTFEDVSRQLQELNKEIDFNQFVLEVAGKKTAEYAQASEQLRIKQTQLVGVLGEQNVRWSEIAASLDGIIARNEKLALAPSPIPPLEGPIGATEEEQRQAAQHVRDYGDALDEARRQAERLREEQFRMLESIFDTMDRGIARVTRGLGFISGVVNRLLGDLARAAFGGILGKLFGLGGPSGSVSFSGGAGSLSFGSIGGGGGPGQGGNVGSFLSQIFGGGGGLFRTAPFAGPSISQQVSGTLPLNLLDRDSLLRAAGLPGLASRPSGFSRFLSGVGGFLSAAGPGALLGGSFGAGIGGSSIPGRILGAAGGGILGTGLGLLGFAAAGGTLSGTTATIASLALGPVGLLLAGGLLIGGLLFGRAAQRRRDEQAADQIWLAELEQTRQLIAQVNSDRLDGQEALAIHAQLRAQTIAGLNQIKTKSVRESRLRNQLRDLDNTVVRELREAADRQARRVTTRSQIVPEFPTGGFVPGPLGRRQFVIAEGGEAVLNRAQQAALKSIAGPNVFRQIGVPEASTHRTPAPDAGGGFRSGTIEITLEADIVIGKREAGGIVAAGARTATGEKVLFRTVRRGRLNREI